MTMLQTIVLVKVVTLKGVLK